MFPKIAATRWWIAPQKPVQNIRNSGFLINELVEKTWPKGKQVYVKAFQKQNPYEWLVQLIQRGINNKIKVLFINLFVYPFVESICQCCPPPPFNAVESKHNDNESGIQFKRLHLNYITSLPFFLMSPTSTLFVCNNDDDNVMMMSLCQFSVVLAGWLAGSSVHFVCT